MDINDMVCRDKPVICDISLLIMTFACALASFRNSALSLSLSYLLS